LFGGTSGGGQAKRPRTTGQPDHATADREGIQMVIVCEGYPEAQVFKDNFTNIQRAVSRLVDKLPEEGFTPRLVNMFWTKGAAVVVCQDEETRDWLASHVPTLRAWGNSRLKMVGLDSLPTYKRVAAWLPGPVEDTLRYLQLLRRLNRGLDTEKWRVYKLRKEPHGVRLVLSVDSKSITALERLRWRPFSGVGHAIFYLLGAKPEERK